jgi:methyl-accepting chemotaxis protein
MEQIDNIKDKVSEYVNKKTIIMCIICFAIGFGAYWLLFGRTDVYDNGNTISTANEQLDRIRENQSDANRELESIRDGINASIDRIEEAEGTVSRIEESANDIRETSRDSIDFIRESEQRIRESKQILEEIGRTKK